MRTYLTLAMDLLHNGDFLSVLYGVLMLALPIVGAYCALTLALDRRR